MERLRQTHCKEIESKDDEVEEIRQSCSKKVNEVKEEFTMCANIARSHLVVLFMGLPRELKDPAQYKSYTLWFLQPSSLPFICRQVYTVWSDPKFCSGDTQKKHHSM